MMFFFIRDRTFDCLVVMATGFVVVEFIVDGHGGRFFGTDKDLSLHLFFFRFCSCNHCHLTICWLASPLLL